jgi:hypothetical protein
MGIGIPDGLRTRRFSVRVRGRLPINGVDLDKSVLQNVMLFPRCDAYARNGQGFKSLAAPATFIVDFTLKVKIIEVALQR